ncbi:MAG: hypothetical protein KKB38_20840, partial [Gammaproteobacteria bacterium]|nr:hypothetical protein [Gammaproteobacteria bacterium]
MGQQEIWGWDDTNKVPRRIVVDENGKPIVVTDCLAHHATHEDGGDDEISVTGLSGLLADDQHVLDAEVLAVAAALAHKTRHQDGGADEISIEGLAGSPAQKAAASGLASLNASTKVVEQPASITDHLEGMPTEDLATKAPTSEWAFDHAADKDIHHSNLGAVTFIIDGGGSAITTGLKGFIELPWAGTIERVSLLADQSGSIVIDIWKDTYANFPPTDADSITASAPPTISSATKAEDETLTGWTTAVSK